MSYSSFKEFYPFYLNEHQNLMCRRLHFLGTLGVLSWVAYCVYTQQYPWIFLALVIGYGPAWIGHFVFEKNRPATFKYPFYSFIGDFRMFWDILIGKVKVF